VKSVDVPKVSKMQTTIMISGTGGQGVIAAAEFLAEALYKNGRHVVNTRSYGAEARGGSARAEVIASDEEIYDLQFEKADIMVILSIPAYRKFVSVGKPGGLMIVDSRVSAKLVSGEIRKDLEVMTVSASDIAERLGNPIVANMVLLAALAKKTQLISIDQLRDAVKTLMRPQFQEINLKAIEEGATAL